MKNKKLYISILIPIFVVSLIFTFFSYYALSVVDKANANGGRDNIAVIVVEPFTNEVKEC